MKTAERELAALDTRHEEIWDALTVLNEQDTSRIVETVLETYMSEAGKLFDRINVEDEEVKEERKPKWRIFQRKRRKEEIINEEPA